MKKEEKPARGLFERPAGSGCLWINYYVGGQQHKVSLKPQGFNPPLLPLIYVVAVDPVLAILSLFPSAALLPFFAVLATITHPPPHISQRPRLTAAQRVSARPSASGQPPTQARQSW